MIGKNIKILKENKNGNKKQSVGIWKRLAYTEALFAAIAGTIGYSKIARVLLQFSNIYAAS